MCDSEDTSLFSFLPASLGLKFLIPTAWEDVTHMCTGWPKKTGPERNVNSLVSLKLAFELYFHSSELPLSPSPFEL